MHASDETLFADYRRTGRPAALGAVYDRVAPELYHVALHLMGHPADAEDVLQSTFVAAIERAETFDAERRVLPWLMGILANQARVVRAKRGRSPDPERLAPDGGGSGPAEVAEETELSEQLDDALLRIPQQYRSVLILRLRHGLTATEIAASLLEPPGTVRSRLARGLDQLRRALPAGLAGAAALQLGTPARGLGVVREAVLAHASAAQPFVLSLASIAGVLVMKKMLLAASALAVLALTWSLSGDGDAPPESGTVRAEAPAEARLEAPDRLRSAEPAGVELAAGIDTEGAAAGGEARTEPAPTAAADVGSLVVHARWETTEEPAEGAVVLLRSHGSNHPFPDERVGRTGPNGEARFDDLPPGHTYVQLLRGSQRSAQVLAGETASLALRVFDGIEVHGEVVDEEGTPVPDATIWLSERWRSNRGYAVATADAAGRFHLPSVSPDHAIGARKGGRLASYLHQLRGEAGDVRSIRIVLDLPSGRVRGLVTDPGAVPVERARVLVGALRQKRVPLETGGDAPGPAPVWTWTDAEGRFEVDGVPFGVQPVEVRAPGFAAARGETIVGRAAAVVELALTPEARVAGRVTDEHGAPVASAWVRTDRAADFASASAFSGEDGTFELGGLPAGIANLVAEQDRAGRARIALDVRAGEVMPWDPRLESVPRVFGTLTDPEGHPLEQWTIALRDEGGRPVTRGSAQTNLAGEFSITAPEASYTLLVNEPGGGWRRFPRLVLRDVWPEPAALELRLTLEQWNVGTFFGVVVGPHGSPVPGTEVSLWHEEARLWRSFPTDPADGRFEIPSVPPGTCQLEVRSEDYPWLHLGGRRVGPGESVDLGTITLEEAGRIAGSIEVPADAEAAALLDSLVFVLVGEDGGREAGVVTRDGSEYRTGPLASGEYEILVRGDLVRSTRVRAMVEAGADVRRDVTLEPAGLKRVLLEVPASAPEPNWTWCSVSNEAGEQVWMGGGLPSRDRIIRARVSVPPGHYSLVAQSNNGLRAYGSFEVEALAEEPEPLRLALSKVDGD